MKLFGWISGIIGAEDDQSFLSQDSLFSDDTCLSDDFAINPANGLPMCDGIGSLDVMGNVYGTDWSDDFLSSSGFDID